MSRNNDDNLNVILVKLTRLEGELESLKNTVEKLDGKLKSTNLNDITDGDQKKLEFIVKRVRFLAAQVAQIQYSDWASSESKNQDLKKIEPKNSKTILVIAASYPNKRNLYGGGFIPARIKAYQKAGYQVTVCVASGLPGSKTRHIEEFQGVRVYTGDTGLLKQRIEEVKPACIIMHSPSLVNYQIVKNYGLDYKLILIFHGYDIRDVEHLWYNYSTDYLNNKFNSLFLQDLKRKVLTIDCFDNRKVSKVFVSEFFYDLVARDIGKKARNTHIIPNFVDGELFKYRKKNKSHRLKIFSIRSFDKYNYGSDMIVDTILFLSEKPFFNELEFHLQGFGELFVEKTKKLQKFDNVKLVEGVITRKAIADLHKLHGIALIPTRFDTQGVTLGEAMSSGLVPVTNRCSAIPEFIPEGCGILANENDYIGLARGIEELYNNPELFLSMSKASSTFIENKCGSFNTIEREISLIKEVAENKPNSLTGKKKIFDKPRRYFIFRALRKVGVRK